MGSLTRRYVYPTGFANSHYFYSNLEDAIQMFCFVEIFRGEGTLGELKELPIVTKD